MKERNIIVKRLGREFRGDKFKHGSKDGKNGGGFTGADTHLISYEWLEKNIRSKGVLGEAYPLYPFLMEGDSPAFMNLIPNGLSIPERPDYGGWGGRYKLSIPLKTMTGTDEKYPIWTDSFDSIIGEDGKRYSSPQATIWRWRSAYQNDFSARMDWTVASEYHEVNHPPVVKCNHEGNMRIYSV